MAKVPAFSINVSTAFADVAATNAAIFNVQCWIENLGPGQVEVVFSTSAVAPAFGTTIPLNPGDHVTGNAPHIWVRSLIGTGVVNAGTRMTLDINAQSQGSAAGVAYDVAPPYLGLVASRGRYADSLASTGAAGVTFMSRKAYVAQDDLSIQSFQLANHNFTSSAAGVEGPSGGPITMTQTVEFAGVLYRVTTAGNASFVLPDMTAEMVTDPIPAIPGLKRGCIFWVNTFQTASAGQKCIYGSLVFNAAFGDRVAFAPGGVTDQTGTLGWTAAQSGICFGPHAVIAMTNRPTAFLVGDSRWMGIGVTNPVNPGLFIGEVEPSLSPLFAVLNASRAGQTALAYSNGGAALRLVGAKYCKYGVMGLSINDLTPGVTTAAGLSALQDTIRGLAPNLKWVGATIGPKTTSSDVWATVSGQTIDGASNTNRIAFNEMVRAGRPGYVGYLEQADFYESSRNSGKFAAPTPNGLDAVITADGLHFTDLGYSRVKANNAGSIFA